MIYQAENGDYAGVEKCTMRREEIYTTNDKGWLERVPSRVRWFFVSGLRLFGWPRFI